jgi:FkbM family methyltransferase
MHDISADPICREFIPWQGRAPAYFDVSFLGQLTDVAFNAGWADAERVRERDAWPPYPKIDEEIFEWRHMLSAILEARGSFTMIEAGCGYGRWLMAAACAIRRRRPEMVFFFMGIEAEPTHFGWLRKHFLDNNVDPDQHHLVFGAVEDLDGEATFVTGHASGWYGQYVANRDCTGRIETYENAKLRKVPAYSLDTLLERFEFVDYIDFDIQMSEARAIRSGIDTMTKKVRRAFVETHGHQIHAIVRDSFRSRGGIRWLAMASVAPTSNAKRKPSTV